MLELTGAMRTELVRLADSLTSTPAAVRLTRDQVGRIHLVADRLTPNDVVLSQPSTLPPLIAAPELAAEVDGAILHFHALADERYDGASLVLLHSRSGAVRPAWSPPQKPKPAPAHDVLGVFRRGGASASTTTQSASL
jgi:hypothetical protein